MSQLKTNDAMPKLGHVTDLREQWLVRADGALAHRLQDREISSHLCENRYRNQQIREDFPVALSEQKDIEHEARLRELARQHQAEIDAEIAREIAEINLRRQRRQHSADLMQQPSSSRSVQHQHLPEPIYSQVSEAEIDPEALGLSPSELEEIRKRLEQEEKDARLARELSHEDQGQDALLADMRCAVEAQDGELARLLQEREYKKLQRAKEKARQKKLQRLALQQNIESPHPDIHPTTPQAMVCDAYSNPRDLIRENGLRLCKSVESDLHYIEPFEKEHIQSKASALQAKEISKQRYPHHFEPVASGSNMNISNVQSLSYDSFENTSSAHNSLSLQHRQPPPPPVIGKKPRFPDPISIRPASHYTTANPVANDSQISNIPHSFTDNNNIPPYSDDITDQAQAKDKRLSVISEITAEGLAKRKNKQDMKKKKGCKIQ